MSNKSELEKANKLLRTALEVSTDGYAICDMGKKDFPLVYASPRCGVLVDCDSDTLVGQPWKRLYKNSVDSQAAFQQIIDNSDSSQTVIRHTKADGSRLWYEVTLYPLQDEKKKTNFFVHVLRDVTERLEAEEAQRMAHHLDTVGAIASGIADQFSNHVASIIAQLSVIQMLAESKNVLTMLSQALQSAQKASLLAQHLQAYAGHSNGQRGVLDVNKVITDTVALVGFTLPPRLAIRFDAARDPLMVKAARGQVQQIVLNLLLNAADASNRSGDIVVTTKAVEWRAQSAENIEQWVLENELPACVAAICVQDNGDGIEADTIKKIFDPFYSTKGTGRGLGLAATLGAVRACGGALGLSTSSAGTTITVLLPLIESVAGDEMTE